MLQEQKCYKNRHWTKLNKKVNATRKEAQYYYTGFMLSNSRVMYGSVVFPYQTVLSINRTRKQKNTHENWKIENTRQPSKLCQEKWKFKKQKWNVSLLTKLTSSIAPNPLVVKSRITFLSHACMNEAERQFPLKCPPTRKTPLTAACYFWSYMRRFVLLHSFFLSALSHPLHLRLHLAFCFSCFIQPVSKCVPSSVR